MNESWRPLHIASSSGNITWRAVQQVSQSRRIISRWPSWWISKSCPGLKQGGFGLDCSNLSSQRSPINWASPILSHTHSQGADLKFKFNPRNKTRSSSSIDYVQLKAKKQKIRGFFLHRHHLQVWRKPSSKPCKRHKRLILYWQHTSNCPTLNWPIETCRFPLKGSCIR